jgi:hypothetical protein
MAKDSLLACKLTDTERLKYRVLLIIYALPE